MVLWRQLVTCSFRVQFRAGKVFINIQACNFKGIKFARYKSKMADDNETITFNSRSKSPYDKFSNFYKAEIKMPEGVFGSVEHYFQAMKFVDKNHSRFEVNGDLGKRKVDSGSWKDTVSRARFIKSAGGKAGTQKYKLTLRKNGLDRERAQQKMKDGLRKKFESEPFKSLLLKTEARKLVHTPMRGKTDYWTGRVDKTSGDIIGENNMGKLLMKVRQELQEAEKSSQNEESFVASEDEGEGELVDEKNDDDDVKGEKGVAGDDKKDKVDIDDNVQRENEGASDKKGEGKDDDDDDDKDENVIGSEVKEDEKKCGDIVKEDAESTSETKDSSGSKGKKRKHEENEVQEGHPDKELPTGPEIKRKKIEVESRNDAESKVEDEMK